MVNLENHRPEFLSPFSLGLPAPMTKYEAVDKKSNPGFDPPPKKEPSRRADFSGVPFSKADGPNGGEKKG
jgi:hypothetical protein